MNIDAVAQAHKDEIGGMSLLYKSMFSQRFDALDAEFVAHGSAVHDTEITTAEDLLIDANGHPDASFAIRAKIRAKALYDRLGIKR